MHLAHGAKCIKPQEKFISNCTLVNRGRPEHSHPVRFRIANAIVPEAQNAAPKRLSACLLAFIWITLAFFVCKYHYCSRGIVVPMHSDGVE